MPIVNLTEMTIRLANADGEVYETIEPSGRTVRLKSSGEQKDIEGVSIEITHITAVEDLPEPDKGTYFIVPEPVARALNRPDLLTPDIGPSAIRDENDRVYATRRLFNVVMDQK